MDQRQKIKQCIQDCQQTVSRLQSISGSAGDKAVKSTLEESAHHLEMCIKECEFAFKQAPQT